MRLLTDLVDPDRVRSGALDGAAEALTDGTTSLMWFEYADRVARLATVLVDKGVRPGDRVAVRLPKSVDSFVAVHAVLRAGGVMVPIDPLAPLPHAASIILDAGAEVLITDHRTAVRADELDGVSTVILPTATTTPEPMDDIAFVDEAEISAASLGDPVGAEPDDPAYIIYTSGSTGAPKGIVHTHRSALAYAGAAVDEYELGASDRFANIAPLHFDQSTFELYAAPLAGGAVLVVPDPIMRFPASLSDLIERERITIWYSVPYLLEQLAQRGVLQERDLSSLRWVLFGGEPFPESALAELMRQLPGATFSNVYGPAEVNQCMAFHLDQPPTRSVPIGTAWPAATIRLVDPNDSATVVPDGTTGLIAVSTATMMQGYWNRPELTDSAMFVADDGSRWYLTGDLARADDGGELMFLGRVDNQVKVRGHRIELEAIDALLREAPAVAAGTIVVDRPDGGDDRLVALVQLDTGATADVTVTSIDDLLKARLPRYAVPAEIVVVDSLPRTATGKIDRRAASTLLGR